MTKLSRKERERLRRKEEILAAAEEIFARDGYENASMNEIAKKAEFSKRTLYKYFENKSDLYLTVALRIYRSLKKESEAINLSEENAYNSIENLSLAFYKFYKKNKSVYRIIYDMQKVKQETDNPKLSEFKAILDYLSESLNELIIMGQKDGSIEKSLDPEKTTASIIILLTGFFNQLSITEHSPIREVNIKEEAFPLYVLDLLNSILKKG